MLINTITINEMFPDVVSYTARFSRQRLGACPAPPKRTERSFPASFPSHKTGFVNHPRCSREPHPSPPPVPLHTAPLSARRPEARAKIFPIPLVKGTKEAAAPAERESLSLKRTTAV